MRPLAVVASTVPVTVHTFHRELLRQLGEAGYRVLVVSSPGPELDLLASTGTVVEAVPMRREVAPVADTRALVAWIRLLRRERPALVVTATPKASLLGLVAARLTGVPRRVHYVGGLRFEGERGLRRTVLRAMERVTAASSDVVVANSPSLARVVLDARVTSEAKLRTIEPASSHGVDATWFTPRPADPDLRASLGLTAHVPVLGFVGRVTADKGMATLVEALRLLRERGRPVQLVVVGSQDERDSAAWVPRLRAVGKVVLVGQVADVRPYLALLDLHVLPTRREGFPNAVLEAAAMAVPTVTTRATGAVDSVRDGVTGVLVDVDAPEQLADAVESLLADAERRRRIGAAAREWVVRDFQPRLVVRSFVGHILSRGGRQEGVPSGEAAAAPDSEA